MIEVLLGQRRWGGRWTVPGGGMENQDLNSYWQCARREVMEEFGHLPFLSCLQPPPGLFLTCIFRNWKTFFVQLPEDVGKYPDVLARDYRHEFKGHSWFPLSNMHMQKLALDPWVSLALFKFRTLRRANLLPRL